MNNPKHFCKYALCNSCWDESTRSNKRQRTSLAINRSACDHRNLDLFTCGDYFKPKYIRVRQERGDHFPTHCAQCKKTVTYMR